MLLWRESLLQEHSPVETKDNAVLQTPEHEVNMDSLLGLTNKREKKLTYKPCVSLSQSAACSYMFMYFKDCILHFSFFFSFLNFLLVSSLVPPPFAVISYIVISCFPLHPYSFHCTKCQVAPKKLIANHSQCQLAQYHLSCITPGLHIFRDLCTLKQCF